MVVGLILPKRDDSLSQQLVDFVRGEGFPSVQYVAQSVWRRWLDNDMYMIGHDHPCSQFVSLSVEKLQGTGHTVGIIRVAQITFSVAAIEVAIHTLGIPTKQILLLVPCERAFGHEGLMENCFPFRFETEQHFLWKCAGQTKCHEISAALPFQIRQPAARMKSGREMIWRRSFTHDCSAGVLAGGLWRRPAASSWFWNGGIFEHRDGARTRRRGRLRYTETRL